MTFKIGIAELALIAILLILFIAAVSDEVTL